MVLKNRKLATLLVVGAVLLTTACSSGSSSTSSEATKEVAAEVLTHTFSWGDFTLATRIADKLKAGETMNVVVDIQGTAIPIFGAQMRAGMIRGCDAEQARLNIECRLAGPVTTNSTSQLAELETILNGGNVDCLALQSPLPDQYVDIINKFVDAGIPVFTMNNDVPNSKRFGFYALSEQEAGAINGAQTAQLVKSRGLKIDTIAMGSGQPAGPWAQQRMAGFEEGYKSVFPDAKFFNDSKSGIPTGDNFTTKEVLDSVGPFFQAHPKVNLFFHTDQGVEGVGQIIAKNNLGGKVWTSGFNVSGPILDSIDQGNTLVTIDQGFDNQGEAPVRACVDYLAAGTAPSDPLQYLKPIVITKDGGEGLQDPATARARLEEANKQ